MIFVTGDTHGDFRRFDGVCFPEQKQMTKDDYVIVCGDFGGIWDGTEDEAVQLDRLADKPFTILWVDGNHENFSLIKEFPVEEWNGGKVHRIRPNILHLMRGQLYIIDGYSFFTMGGASSHDIQDGILDPEDPDFMEELYRLRQRHGMFRVKGWSWWPEELPSEEEYAEARETLERADWEVDYVITHSAPSGIVKKVNERYQTDALTDFLEEVREKLKFHYWLFGHYHDNRNIGNNFVLLYEQLVQAI